MATVNIIIADVSPEESQGDNLRIRFVFDPPITEASGSGTAAQLLAMDAIRWLGDRKTDPADDLI